MDNATMHKTHDVRACFNKKIEQRFLPAYSCELNPIERFWSVIKREWRKYLLSKTEVMNDEDTIKTLTEIIEANRHKASNIAASHVSSM